MGNGSDNFDLVRCAESVRASDTDSIVSMLYTVVYELNYSFLAVVKYGDRTRLDGDSRPLVGDVVVSRYVLITLHNKEADRQGNVCDYVLMGSGSDNFDHVRGAKSVRAANAYCAVGALNCVVNELNVSVLAIVENGNGSRKNSNGGPFLGDIVVRGHVHTVTVKNSEIELQGCARNNVLMSDGSGKANFMRGAKSVRSANAYCAVGALDCVVNELNVSFLTLVENGDGSRKNGNC